MLVISRLGQVLIFILHSSIITQKTIQQKTSSQRHQIAAPDIRIVEASHDVEGVFFGAVAAQILGFYKAARVQVSQIYDIDTSSTHKLALLMDGEWVVGIAEQNAHRSAGPEQPFSLRISL